jgi:hypothetical protein
MKRILGTVALVGLVGLTGVAIDASKVSAVTLPQGPAVFETSLQSRISSTDTSMKLVANSVRGGSTLSGYQCFTIDEGRTDAEYVGGTISATSVTSLERGIDALTGISPQRTEARSPRGCQCQVTDFPLIQRLRNLANGIEGCPIHSSTSRTRARSAAPPMRFATRTTARAVPTTSLLAGPPPRLRRWAENPSWLH